MTMTVDAAIEAALRLEETAQVEGIEVAHATLARAVKDLESQGYPIDSLFPGCADQGLESAPRKLTGGRFFEIYSGMLRDKLCTEDGEFSKLIRAGLGSSVSAALPALLSALALPPAALALAIPLAVIMASTGLDAFCAATKTP